MSKNKKVSFKLAGGKSWAIEEEALKTGKEVCYCGKGIATENVYGEGKGFGDRPILAKVCLSCKKEDDLYEIKLQQSKDFYRQTFPEFFR